MTAAEWTGPECFMCNGTGRDRTAVTEPHGIRPRRRPRRKRAVPRLQRPRARLRGRRNPRCRNGFRRSFGGRVGYDKRTRTHARDPREGANRPGAWPDC